MPGETSVPSPAVLCVGLALSCRCAPAAWMLYSRCLDNEWDHLTRGRILLFLNLSEGQ